ncbi:excisionase family DNA-binding protein [Streptomyces chilikensis]|uniref:Excisionase family DNA-binding protein n=1 Tax=Streptomyces chilikensis TaxID=1194079 RepID=A0ABV3EJ48_9ACTN
MSQLLYTVDQAAAQLGIGRTTFYELVGEGAIRTVQIRSARRVPADALAEYVTRLDREQNGTDVAELRPV